MKTVKRIGRFIMDLFEIYLPVIVYICLFLTFVYQIFCRYVLCQPVSWSYEIGLLTFVWTTMFGALYAWRDDEHIVFSLVYDARSERGKRIFDLIGAIIVLVLMAIIVYPTFTFILKQRRFSSVLKISYKVMYFPFLIMLIGTCIHQIKRIVRAVGALKALKGADEKAVKKEEAMK